MPEGRQLNSSGKHVLNCKSRHSGLRFAGTLACMILGFALTEMGQSAGNFDTGTITGTVSDPSGAVIPHASVTITNTGTGIVTNAKTGDTGLYTVPALPFGTYVVSAAADKFGKAASAPFVLNAGATTRVDLKLSLAAISTSLWIWQSRNRLQRRMCEAHCEPADQLTPATAHRRAKMLNRH